MVRLLLLSNTGTKVPTLLVIIIHLSVVSSRQRSENQGFDDRRRCDEKKLMIRIIKIDCNQCERRYKYVINVNSS